VQGEKKRPLLPVFLTSPLGKEKGSELTEDFALRKKGKRKREKDACARNNAFYISFLDKGGKDAGKGGGEETMLKDTCHKKGRRA